MGVRDTLPARRVRCDSGERKGECVGGNGVCCVGRAGWLSGVCRLSMDGPPYQPGLCHPCVAHNQANAPATGCRKKGDSGGPQVVCHGTAVASPRCASGPVHAPTTGAPPRHSTHTSYTLLAAVFCVPTPTKKTRQFLSHLAMRKPHSPLPATHQISSPLEFLKSPRCPLEFRWQRACMQLMRVNCLLRNVVLSWKSPALMRSDVL